MSPASSAIGQDNSESPPAAGLSRVPWWRRELLWGLSGWSAGALLVALLVAAPLLALLPRLFAAPGEEWAHVRETLLSGHLRDTAVVLGGTLLLSLVFALPAAWWVTIHEFPGRRVLEWALLLPLALPAYLSAFAYFQSLDLFIPFYLAIRERFGATAFLWAQDAVRYGTLMLLMAGALFPYVYLTARASFAQQARSTMEAARMLGLGAGARFFRVALPLARPAIAVGLALVGMETLNDYGAATTFGVSTFTVGIFRSWLSLGDLDSAVRLAACLMALVAALLLWERWQRGRRRFAESSGSSSAPAREPLGPGKGFAVLLGCLVPLGAGFLLPGGRLLWWAAQSWDSSSAGRLLSVSGQSAALAGGVTVAILVAAILVAYAGRLHRTRLMRGAFRVATLGYAIPGAVVAVGVLTLLGGWDRWFQASGWFLSGTLLAVGYAYLVRYLAVAAQPVESGLTRLAGQLDEAARTLGARPWRAFWQVDFPLVRPAVAGAGILVFVDLLKELPLTLVLRPFNFETLATKAFSLAQEARFGEAAILSLGLAVLSLAGLIPLNRLIGSPNDQ